MRTSSTQLALGVAILATTLSASSTPYKLHSSHLLTAPSLPLGLYKHLQRQEQDSDAQSAVPTQHDQLVFTTESDPSVAGMTAQQQVLVKYPERWFDQKVSHDPDVLPEAGHDTFANRYWFDAQFYKPGGPVFLLLAGETSGENRLPFLDTGILNILSKATGGIGVVLEHRYYGESWPVANLTTDNLRYLTTKQSLDDATHFARNIKFPGLEHLNLTAPNTPWISYGGSYAGGQSAFLRKLYPEVWWGSIASSAVTKAIVDYWEYFEPIRVNAPAECMSLLTKHTAAIDSLLALNNAPVTQALKNYFGLGGVTRNEDFVNALTLPLGSWQARNWDPAVSTDAFFGFCNKLVGDDDDEPGLGERLYGQLEEALKGALSLPSWPGRSFASFSNYAAFVKDNIAAACPEEDDQDLCFGNGEYADEDVSIKGAEWKAWPLQFCTEWGYLQGGAPEGQPTIVSRLLTPEYTGEICQLAFPPGGKFAVPAQPNVTAVNQWGGFEIAADRLAFIDGSADPWIYATPHSPNAEGGGERADSVKRPFKLIEGGVHHWDENGLREPAHEPKEIRRVHAEEVAFVQEWMSEWRGRGKWRTED